MSSAYPRYGYARESVDAYEVSAGALSFHRFLVRDLDFSTCSSHRVMCTSKACVADEGWQ